jgi:hypothetical protein
LEIMRTSIFPPYEAGRGLQNRIESQSVGPHDMPGFWLGILSGMIVSGVARLLDEGSGVLQLLRP